MNLHTKRIVITYSLLLLLLGACSRTNTTVPLLPAAPVSDNSYLDLHAGSKLKIVVPLSKSGSYRSTLRVAEAKNNTTTFASDDITGYVTSEYAVSGKDAVVRLKWITTRKSIEGKTLPVSDPSSLPFELPRRSEHIRLIYLVRVSEADHNMAIVGSKRLDSLNLFTARLRQNPSICKTDEKVFCSWVPAGIAVRPE